MIKKKILGKFVFILTHSILMILVLVAILQCLIVFSSWPSYTKIRVAPQHKSEFPSLTICPESPSYKMNVLRVSRPDPFKSWPRERNFCDPPNIIIDS